MTTADPFARTREDVADKVRKLLTQAEDPAATPEEAQAFTMKAQQLMSKYSIELAMIVDPAKADQLTETGWTVNGPYAGHKVSLINAVARANDCRAIYLDLSGGRKRIQVVGYPGDVDWVEALSRSLEIQLAGALASAVGAKPRHVHGRTFAVGFIEGFTAEVNGRLQQARRTAVAGFESAREEERRRARRETMDALVQVEPTATSVALVLTAKAKHVDDEFKARHPTARTVYSQVRLQSWSGYDPGRAAGRQATLARGAVGSNRRGLSA
jgi:hypothetical protein